MKNGPDLSKLIHKCYDFIETEYLTGDLHTKDLINTSFFKIIVTSRDLIEYASKNFSAAFFSTMSKVWSDG